MATQQLTKRQRKALEASAGPKNSIGQIIRLANGEKRLFQNSEIPRRWPHRVQDEPIAPLASGGCTTCGGAYSELMQQNRPVDGQVWQHRACQCQECRLEDMAIRAERLARQLHTGANDLDDDYIPAPYLPEEVREQIGYRDPPIEGTGSRQSAAHS